MGDFEPIPCKCPRCGRLIEAITEDSDPHQCTPHASFIILNGGKNGKKDND